MILTMVRVDIMMIILITLIDDLTWLQMIVMMFMLINSPPVGTQRILQPMTTKLCLLRRRIHLLLWESRSLKGICQGITHNISRSILTPKRFFCFLGAWNRHCILKHFYIICTLEYTWHANNQDHDYGHDNHHHDHFVSHCQL